MLSAGLDVRSNLTSLRILTCSRAGTMSQNLLHKVDVRHISAPVLQVLKALMQEAVREALSQQGLGSAPAALKVVEAAKYVGLSRSRLYELLKTDRMIQSAAIKQGKARIFLVAGLDQWLLSQQTAEQEPQIKVAV
jgi:hypothetical protein